MELIGSEKNNWSGVIWSGLETATGGFSRESDAGGLR